METSSGTNLLVLAFAVVEAGGIEGVHYILPEDVIKLIIHYMNNMIYIRNLIHSIHWQKLGYFESSSILNWNSSSKLGDKQMLSYRNNIIEYSLHALGIQVYDKKKIQIGMKLNTKLWNLLPLIKKMKFGVEIWCTKNDKKHYDFGEIKLSQSNKSKLLLLFDDIPIEIMKGGFICKFCVEFASSNDI